MHNTGQGSEKKSYRVLLLLVVGLAAFSSAMKELNEVHQLTLQTSSLLAQWSDRVIPTDATIKIETCENQIPSLPAPPPPPLAVVPALPQGRPAEPLPPAEVDQPEQSDSPEVVTPEVPPAPTRVRQVSAVKPRQAMRLAPAAAAVQVLVTSDDFVQKSIKDAFETDPSLRALKAKNRRHILITPDGKDVILKTLNRSINLRSAS